MWHIELPYLRHIVEVTEVKGGENKIQLLIYVYRRGWRNSKIKGIVPRDGYFLKNYKIKSVLTVLYVR
jgi:hypothetical protein